MKMEHYQMLNKNTMNRQAKTRPFHKIMKNKKPTKTQMKITLVNAYQLSV